MIKQTQNNLNGQKGQVLLFVVVALTIALAVGTGISLRSLSSISRATSSDTASRVLAAAEGGIERFITKSEGELETRVDNCNDCEITFDPQQSFILTDKITAKATVTIERYTGKDENGNYAIILKQDQIADVNMVGYNPKSIDLCWTPESSTTNTDIAYFAWGKDGSDYDFIKGGAKAGTRNGFPAAYDTNFPNATSGHGYSDCTTVNSLPKDIISLRIKSINGNSKVYLFPAGNAKLPYQGYKITSVGRLIQDSAITATKTIVVTRSLSYLPDIFNHTIFSGGGPLN